MVEKIKLNGWSGWVTAGIAVAGVFMAVGILYRDVCLGAEANKRQDEAIYSLQRDMALMTQGQAVIQTTTVRMADDITELKQDVKQLLRRP